MKNIVLASLVSLLIHLLFFLNFKYEKNEQQNEEKKFEKTDIKFVKLEEKKVEVPVEKPKEEPISKPTPPPTKKEIQKPIIKEEKVVKKVEKPKVLETPKKPVKKEIEKAKEFQNKVLKEQVVTDKPNIQDKTLENFLSQKEPVNKEVLTELEKLYGKEFDTFTKVQKAYLEKNLNNFQIITQRVLNRMGYPKLAAKLQIGGVNIVEFMFHPDGSITGLKITNSSGYTILDDYSLELIEIAYKDYPKPTEKTKIKFQVFYRIF
ncbi:energy transducer TonB [Arcobacter vandammei]|uniref:energy transducer TonB n=1 Tax=Arcobacter vandammei TaxID=2782243 RepID=UPI0018E0065E|nr:energy transducer TonB [Arcobacter vandammei]